MKISDCEGVEGKGDELGSVEFSHLKSNHISRIVRIHPKRDSPIRLPLIDLRQESSHEKRAVEHLHQYFERKSGKKRD